MSKKAVKNLLWVALMQGGNYLLPLITLPVLIRYLGPAEYGLFNLSQTWSNYFSVIIAFGFDLTSTREIAISTHTVKEMSTVYSKVLFSKIYLCIALFIVFILVIFFNPSLQEHFLVYIFMYFWTLNIVFFQGWFYMGLEKPAKVSVFNFLSRAVSFIVILVLIFFKFSLIWLVLAYSIPQAVIAYFFHRYTIQYFKLKVKPVKLKLVLHYLRESLVLFLSTIAGTITFSLSVIMLGFLSSKESVGYFSVSSKLVAVILGLVLYPFQIVFFPLIIKKVKASIQEGIQYFLKLLGISCSVMGLVIAAIYFYSPLVIHLFVGNKFDASIGSLRIVCFVPFFSLADTLFGFLLIAFDKRLLYTLFLLTGSLVCFASNLLLIPKLQETGSSYSWLLAEMSCFLCFLVYFIFKWNKKGFRLIQPSLN